MSEISSLSLKLPKPLALPENRSGMDKGHSKFMMLKPLSYVNFKVPAAWKQEERRSPWASRRAENPRTRIARKYFGKKVTIIGKSNQAANLHEKSKYIKSLRVGIMKYYRSNPSDELRMESFASKGGLIILCGDIIIQEGCHSKIMPVYRSDDTMFRPPRLNKSWFQRMTSIQHLNLFIRQGWAYTLRLTFEGKSIKGFNLSSQLIQELRDGEFENEYMESCIRELLRMSNLTAITLDLRTFNASFKNELYSFIARSNINTWQIRDSVSSLKDIYFQDLPKPLKTADFIHFTRYSPDRHGERHGEMEDRKHPQAFQHMADLRSLSNKKLTLIVQPDSLLKTKDYKLILDQCQILKSLCLELDPKASDIVVNEDIVLIQSMRKIKNVVIRASGNVWSADPYNTNEQNNNQVDRDRRGIGRRMRDEEDSANSTNRQFKLISFIDSNHTHSGHLKHLRLHECNILPPNYTKDNFLARYLTNGIESDYTLSQKIRPLEHLDLSIHASLDKERLHKLLDSFDSLKVLNLGVEISQMREAWDENLPYSRLKDLQELRINMREDRRNRRREPDNSDDRIEFGVYLGRNLSQLKSLRVFELDDRFSGKMGRSVFYGLLKPCTQLTQLEKLVIKVYIEKEEEIYDKYNIMPETWNEVVRLRRKVLEDLLDGSVEEIKVSNPNLKLMNLEGFSQYGRSEIWYERSGRTKEDLRSEESRYQDVRSELLDKEQLF